MLSAPTPSETYACNAIGFSYHTYQRPTVAKLVCTLQQSSHAYQTEYLMLQILETLTFKALRLPALPTLNVQCVVSDNLFLSP